MRSVALVIAVLVGLIAPAAAQRANIDAANAKWIELFNKGDFDGVASLYTTDATTFPYSINSSARPRVEVER